MKILREKMFTWIMHRQAARKVKMPNWEKVRSVAVLYPTDTIPHIIQEIEQANKDVVLFTLPEKNHICWLTERPSRKVIDKITTRSFDVLIDLSQEPMRTLQYMAMYIPADFKVGRHMRDGIHDLTIDTPPQATPDYLYEQILRYIHMFTQQ